MVDVLHYKMQDAFVILSHFLKGLISVLKIHFERVFFLDNLCLVGVLCSSLYSCIYYMHFSYSEWGALWKKGGDEILIAPLLTGVCFTEFYFLGNFL